MPETVTAFVAIGNSDDKLTQAMWSRYVAATDEVVERWAIEVHGRWYSLPDSRYQNACWCLETSAHELESLRERLAVLAYSFDQESIALTVGTTEFITAAS